MIYDHDDQADFWGNGDKYWNAVPSKNHKLRQSHFKGWILLNGKWPKRYEHRTGHSYFFFFLFSFFFFLFMFLYGRHEIWKETLLRSFGVGQIDRWNLSQVQWNEVLPLFWKRLSSLVVANPNPNETCLSGASFVVVSFRICCCFHAESCTNPQFGAVWVLKGELYLYITGAWENEIEFISHKTQSKKKFGQKSLIGN